MNRKTVFLVAGLILIASGCSSIAKREEVVSVQEEVTQINAALGKQIVFLKEYTDEKIADQAKEGARDRAAVSEKAEGLATEIRTLSGKLDELEYKTRELTEKNRSENESKISEFRRDIENFRKAQTDVMTTIASVNQSVTLMQNDLLALKNHQVDVTAALEKINLQIEKQNTGDVSALREEFDKKMQVLLNEITRQESELFILRSAAGKTPETAAVKTEIKEKKESAPAAKKKTVIYVVKYGDYLSRIAKKHNTTKKAIMKLNNVTDDNIYPGQKLKIPSPE